MRRNPIGQKKLSLLVAEARELVFFSRLSQDCGYHSSGVDRMVVKTKVPLKPTKNGSLQAHEYVPLLPLLVEVRPLLLKQEVIAALEV